MEQWIDIPGYVGRYQISDKGRVRSLQFKGKKRNEPLIMSPYINVDGYYLTTLTDENKRTYKYSIQRLMAISWLGLPEDSALFAYSLNGDKADLSLENIGIGARDGRCGGSRRRPVRKLDRDTGAVVAEYPSVTEAAKQNYMCYANMMDCLHGRKKRPTEYIYEYANKDGAR